MWEAHPDLQLKTMKRLYMVFAILVSTVLGADHTTFKNCSRVSFCSDLRYQTLDSSSQFAANPSAIVKENNITILPLYNSKNESLRMQIILLSGYEVRVKILEVEPSRYVLSDILNEVPKQLAINIKILTEKSISLISDDSLETHKVIVNAGPPFTVEFYHGNQLQTVLKGDRMSMKNTENSQAFTFGIEFEGASKLYGLHHHAYKLAPLAETADGSTDPYSLRNSDTANYEVNSTMALYGSVPVIYGHSVNSTSGIFLHNAAEQWVDISYNKSKPSAYFMVESGVFDLFVLLGPNLKEVVRQFTILTGVAHMPQVKYQEDNMLPPMSMVLLHPGRRERSIVAQMDNHDLPMEAIWLDIDYTDGKRYFTWNPDNFSDPIEMQKNISSTYRKLVTILDPHIKVDNNYSVYVEAKDKYFVKWANGSDFEGNCWPGLSSYLDFLNPDARDFYASWYGYDKFNGSTETHQGLMQRDNGTKRPFILTRSHFAGSQRYAAMWTGDNTADWSYLALSYSECLLSNILGLVFCGADIGGFFNDPDAELLQRWYQAAVWLPFYRGHAAEGTPRREPYLFDEDVQTVIRNAIKLRYKHIPIFYTLFYEHTRHGDPVVRPLFYDYPEFLEYDGYILVGSNILARPVLEPKVSRVTVEFPGDERNFWYRVDNGSWVIHPGGSVENLDVDINTSPLFYRGASIISRKDEEKPSTTHMLDDPYTLYVNLDANNNAEGRLYVDDYVSFDYSTDGLYFYVRLKYITETNGISVHQIDGNSTGFNVFLQSVVIHGATTGGVDEPISTTYTTTADGIPLNTINLVEHLNMRSGDLMLRF